MDCFFYQSQMVRGMCNRYPQAVEKSPQEFCGEFLAKGGVMEVSPPSEEQKMYSRSVTEIQGRLEDQKEAEATERLKAQEARLEKSARRGRPPKP